MNKNVGDVWKVGIKCFRAQEAEMSLMALLVAMGEIKICYGRDKHDVYKVEIKVFRAQEGEMSLIAVNLFESAKSVFFTNARYMTSTKLE